MALQAVIFISWAIDRAADFVQVFSAIRVCKDSIANDRSMRERESVAGFQSPQRAISTISRRLSCA